MQQKYYSADRGCCTILINMNNVIDILNDYGDGYFKIYLFDNEDEFTEYKQEHLQYSFMQECDYHIAGRYIFNNALVLEDDCIHQHISNIDKLKEYALFTLNGNYYIYVNNGKIYIVKSNY